MYSGSVTTGKTLFGGGNAERLPARQRLLLPDHLPQQQDIAVRRETFGTELVRLLLTFLTRAASGAEAAE